MTPLSPLTLTLDAPAVVLLVLTVVAYGVGCYLLGVLEERWEGRRRGLREDDDAGRGSWRW